MLQKGNTTASFSAAFQCLPQCFAFLSPGIDESHTKEKNDSDTGLRCLFVSGFTHVLKSYGQHCFSVKKALERVLVFQTEVNIDKVPVCLSGQKTQLNQ